MISQMLNEESTLYYIRLAKQGDNAAKEVLLSENISLLKSIIRRYLNKGLEYDDLYQLASIGLLKAINGFDESYQVKFSTYAVPMIAGEIKRFMRDDGMVKVSRSMKMTAKKINQFIEEQQQLTGQSPSIAEIATKFAIEENEVVFILGSSKMPISIYEQADRQDEQGQSILEKLPAVDTQESMLESLDLKKLIASLPERERKIIILRYFRDMTQTEVAEEIGVSQVQISRIEQKVVQYLKKELG